MTTKVTKQMMESGTANFLLGYDGSGNVTEIDPATVTPFDIDALSNSLINADSADLLAISDQSAAGEEKKITLTNLANSLEALGIIGAGGSGGLVGVQSFTSSGTYTPTAGTNSVLVICTGGGTSSATGSAGTSSFGGFCSATGGSSGQGGNGVGGSLNIEGGDSFTITANNTSPDISSSNIPGGSSFWGSSGSGGGVAYGAGGLGSGSLTGTGQSMSSGAAGGTSITHVTSGFSGTSVTVGSGNGPTGNPGVVFVFEYA